MDEMQVYEIDDLVDVLPNTNRQEWEMCRFQMYSQVQSFSSKKLKPKDIISFPWDNEEKESSNSSKVVTNEDIERMANKVKMLEQKIKNKELKYTEYDGRF